MTGCQMTAKNTRHPPNRGVMNDLTIAFKLDIHLLTWRHTPVLREFGDIFKKEWTTRRECEFRRVRHQTKCDVESGGELCTKQKTG